jgi:hypothetical protein
VLILARFACDTENCLRADTAHPTVAYCPMDADRNRERWFWSIAGAVAVAVVAVLYAFSAPDGINPATQPTASSALKQAPDEQKPPSRIVIERAADARTATVFECRVNGQRIYSDQRCGSMSEEHPIQAPNRMDAQDTGILSSPEEILARSRSERWHAQEPVVDAGSDDCTRIEDEKNSIDARMRKGYMASEGEFLRDRLRVLSARYYDLRCRHIH